MAFLITRMVLIVVLLPDLIMGICDKICFEGCEENRLQSMPDHPRIPPSHRDRRSRLDVIHMFQARENQNMWKADLSNTLTYPQVKVAGEGQFCLVSGRKANCSCQCLHSVPQNLSKDILQLDLSCNLLVTLNNFSFSRYPLLQRLNISHNNLTTLEEHSFFNLSQLLSLDLYNNSLATNNVTYPDGIFRPMASLTYLRINRNNPNLTVEGLDYPAKALSYLTNLHQLHMDGLPVYHETRFQEEFRNLTKLKALSLAGFEDGYCDLRYLNNNTFENLGTLEILNIADCGITGPYITSGAFSPLKRLRLLNLTHNEDIDIENLNKIFHGLQLARNLTHLKIGTIVNRYSVGICLDSSLIDNIPQSLTYLDAGQNNIEGVSPTVIDRMPPDLQTLNLRGNRFVFGAYMKDLWKMKKLKYVKLSCARYTYHIPKVYPFRKDRKPNIYTDHSKCSLYFHKGVKFILQLPPNLEIITMDGANLRYILSELYVNETNSLRSLYLHDNHFPRLEGPFYGLHSLTNLDISSSFVSSISNVFFQHLTALRFLNLSSNLLGDTINSNSDDTIFSALKELQILDLSFNDIQSLPQKIFSSLTKLRTLNMSKNSFSSFNADIVGMQNLHFLDLSKTHISLLPPQTCKAIDGLIDKGIKVKVRMEYTPIACDCDNYQFLQWMVASPAFHRRKPFHHYLCHEDTAKRYITDGYNATLALLKRKCASNTLIFFITGSLTTILLGFIVGLLLYRFRWNIRYMYYAAYLHYRGNPQGKERTFEYDAFVCYAEEDMDFAEHILDKNLSDRDLKVFLHQRDFTAGEFITSNIVKAVCCSKKTLVILTSALMESHWCSYEIEMARMEGLYTGRQVLIFIIMEKIPKAKLGKELLYNINNNTYQEYPALPTEANQLELWWDKLANDIRA